MKTFILRYILLVATIGLITTGNISTAQAQSLPDVPVNSWLKSYKQHTQPVDMPVDSTNPSVTSIAPDLLSVLDEKYYTNQDKVVLTIMGFRKNYPYILEIMMLVIAVVGPIFLVLALFPAGTKLLIGWGISFLSLGFCKICYSLMSALLSIAFVYAGPESTNMIVVAVALGLLAPLLSFTIASVSGLAAFKAINRVRSGGT